VPAQGLALWPILAVFSKADDAALRRVDAHRVANNYLVLHALAGTVVRTHTQTPELHRQHVPCSTGDMSRAHRAARVCCTDLHNSTSLVGGAATEPLDRCSRAKMLVCKRLC
jgi:hypothetical protein